MDTKDKYCVCMYQILYQHSTNLDMVPGSIGPVLEYIELLAYTLNFNPLILMSIF